MVRSHLALLVPCGLCRYVHASVKRNNCSSYGHISPICLHFSELLTWLLLFLYCFLGPISSLEMHCLYSCQCLRSFIEQTSTVISPLVVFSFPSLKQLRISKSRKAQGNGFRIGSRVVYELAADIPNLYWRRSCITYFSDIFTGKRGSSAVHLWISLLLLRP